jgi:hypothetical protein
MAGGGPDPCRQTAAAIGHSPGCWQLGPVSVLAYRCQRHAVAVYSKWQELAGKKSRPASALLGRDVRGLV